MPVELTEEQKRLIADLEFFRDEHCHKAPYINSLIMQVYAAETDEELKEIQQDVARWTWEV